MRSFARVTVGSGERILSTILFTDIVGSTAKAVEVGHAAWRDLLSQHNERGRYELNRFRGREIDTTGGDGRAHALGEGHSVMYQTPAGEGWIWCYDENAYVG